MCDILISIIVPVYNVEKYLDECLTSLVNQSYSNIEIILVDDGSKDKSSFICDDYAKRYENIVVIHKENAGLGMARNSGIDIAKGKWVGFVDSDDYVETNMYENLLNLVIQNEADMASCLFCNSSKRNTNIVNKLFEGENQVLQVAFGMVGTPPEYPQDAMFSMSSCNSIYKRRILSQNNIRFPSERECSSEDLIFNLKYIVSIKSIIYTTARYYHYRNNENSLTHTYYPDKFRKEKRLIHMVEAILESYSQQYGTSMIIDRLLIMKMRISILNCTYSINSFGFKKVNKLVKEIVKDNDVREVVNRYPGYKLRGSKRLVFYLAKFKQVKILILLSYIFGKKHHKL